MGRLAGLLLVFVSLAVADPARDFARRIASALGPQDTVSISVRGLTPEIPAADVSALRSALEEELRPRLAGTSAPATVNVTVAENKEGYVWVAEITRGEKKETIIGSRPRPAATDQEEPEAPLSIEKKLVWEQQEPILDLVSREGTLAVLEPARLVIYQRQEARWQRRESLGFPDGWFAPRDPRGRLELKDGVLIATLPGLRCTGTAGGAMEWKCDEAETDLASGRNFFEKPAPAFSSAALGETSIAAGLDGRVHIGSESFAGWGSDIAALSTPCGSGRQALATSAAEAGEPDSVQAYEIADGKPVAVSAPLELPGPVTALWSAQDGTALAVVRNLKTGRYAASILSISCPR